MSNKIHDNPPTYLEPIIDSHNPPINVDSLLLGESSDGALRLTCFGGMLFVAKEESYATPEGSSKRVWARPTCVLDLKEGPLDLLSAHLFSRLIKHPETLKYLMQQMPELKLALKEALPALKEMLEE